MKKLAFLLILPVWASWTPGASLYDQSIAKVLRQRFASPSVSYLMVDVATQTLVASEWDSPSEPVPAGSLVKPFTALAYGQSHGYRYPELVCRGARDGCWLARGHGRIGMTEAIGYSCNAYFRKLAELVSREAIGQVTVRYGMRSRLRSLSASSLTGLGDGMEIPPTQLAQAYIELTAHHDDPGVPELLEGMALSARAGTAKAIQQSFPGAQVLAKTGTAPCVHRSRAPGDGYAIALYPADSPRVALLVRVHGVPGAQAAALAGEMLRIIATGK